jgi:hypothetical protein
VVSSRIRPARCRFTTCSSAATVEEIGTYDGVVRIEETVTIALALCERHAGALRNEVVLLETA